MTDFVREIASCNQAEMTAVMAATFEQWQSDRGTAPGPNWKSVDLVRLPSPIIPWSALIDVVGPGGEGMIYRYWGSNRTTVSGMDMTGKTVADLRPAFLRDKVVNENLEVLANGKPIHIRTTVQRQDGPISYEMLRAPLSRNGTSITGLYSAMLYIGNVFITSETLFDGVTPD